MPKYCCGTYNYFPSHSWKWTQNKCKYHILIFLLQMKLIKGHVRKTNLASFTNWHKFKSTTLSSECMCVYHSTQTVLRVPLLCYEFNFDHKWNKCLYGKEVNFVKIIVISQFFCVTTVFYIHFFCELMTDKAQFYILCSTTTYRLTSQTRSWCYHTRVSYPMLPIIL